MAELDIGKHCTVPSCKQLDFLPITCKGCSQSFCKDHVHFDSHGCSQVNVVAATGEYAGPKSYVCEVEGCHQRELTEITCEACHKRVCLSHRHQVDHNCEKYEAPPERMKQTQAHIEKIIEAKKSTPTKSKGRGRKSKVTAAKVALMKIKMSAVGDKSIPESERIFLQVILPQGSASRSRPMYFSRVWSMGRVIDAMASLAGLRNDNNVAGAKKLRLFDADDGHIFTTNQTLDYHLAAEDGIINGGTTILEYVEDGTSQIDDVGIYRL